MIEFLYEYSKEYPKSGWHDWYFSAEWRCVWKNHDWVEQGTGRTNVESSWGKPPKNLCWSNSNLPPKNLFEVCPKSFNKKTKANIVRGNKKHFSCRNFGGFFGRFVVICLCLLKLTFLAPESMDASKKWFVSFWDPAYFSFREGTCFPFLAQKRPRFSNSSRVQHRCRATLSKLKALTSQSCSTGIGVSVSFRFIGSSVAKGFLKSQAGDKREKKNMSWW